jgi:hypothetical protein
MKRFALSIFQMAEYSARNTRQGLKRNFEAGSCVHRILTAQTLQKEGAVRITHCFSIWIVSSSTTGMQTWWKLSQKLL